MLTKEIIAIICTFENKTVRDQTHAHAHERSAYLVQTNRYNIELFDAIKKWSCIDTMKIQFKSINRSVCSQ